MEHQGTVALSTERLLLRRFTLEDADVMYANWARDEQVTTYLTWPAHKSYTVTRDVVRQWSIAYANPRFYEWEITLQADGTPIGSIGVVRQNEEVEEMDIGFCLGRPWWHHGFATEAVQAVIAFLIEQVKANRVAAWHDPRNVNSGHVLDRCGMRLEGTLRQADRNNTGIVDMVMHAILADDYRAAPSEASGRS